jgi:hypothetical protein
MVGCVAVHVTLVMTMPMTSTSTATTTYNDASRVSLQSLETTLANNNNINKNNNNKATKSQATQHSPPLSVHQQKQKQQLQTVSTTSTSDDTTLRSTLLQHLMTLPNNITQREVPYATARTHAGGRITLCTQGGVSKLARLRDLVGRWLGPISCAIYITTEDQLDDWLTFLRTNRQDDADMDLIATYVTFHVLLEQPQLPLTVNRHPINKLRNLALHHVETDHVFLNDIDFMPPTNAHDTIVQRYYYATTNTKGGGLPPPKLFWVLPAFERFGTLVSSTSSSSSSVLSVQQQRQLKSSQQQQQQQQQQQHQKRPRRHQELRNDVTDITWIPESKAALVQAVSLSIPEVAPFHDYFPAGHAPCNYSHWYTATAIYNITYHYLFEPYVIVHTQGLPEYYPTFRGFAFNKMSFFMEAHYMGYQFQVLPDVFVVHMNHGGRKGRNDKGGDSKYVKEDFRKYLKDKYHVSQQELDLWK